MSKKLLFLAIVLSANLAAMEHPCPNQTWHKPEVKEDVKKMFSDYFNNSNADIGKETVEKGMDAALLPILLCTKLGGTLSDKILSNDSAYSSRMIGPMIGFGLGFIPSLPFGMLCAVGGAGYGAISGVAKKIDAEINKPQFTREVTLALYKWIASIKQIREAIKQKIIAVQEETHNLSIHEAFNNLLANEKLKGYLQELNMSPEQCRDMINNIDMQNDNWDNFFPAFAKQFKDRDASDEFWQKLEFGLNNYSGDKEGFPEVTEADIKDYLYLAVYFFDVFNDHYLNNILNAYVGNISCDH